jgi:hypothetical protein
MWKYVLLEISLLPTEDTAFARVIDQWLARLAIHARVAG